jgi:hypothetical protein
MLIFPTPIGLNTFDLGVKEVLNVCLKLEENALNINSINHKMNPCKFCKVINKINVIFITINKNWSRTPNIRMNEF